jgi:hypothetical protein
MPGPFPQPPELTDTLTVLQLRAQWTLLHQGRGESSWSFLMIQNGLVDQPAIILDNWMTYCHDLWVRRRPTSWVLNRLWVQDRIPGIRPDLIVELEQHGGWSNGDASPVQFGPLISWRTAYRGRSYRGRTFWGPIAKDDMEETFVTNALNADLDDWAFAMLTMMGGGFASETSPLFSVVSRQHDLVPEPIGRAAPIIGYKPIRLMATQRRRQQFYHV